MAVRNKAGKISAGTKRNTWAVLSTHECPGQVLRHSRTQPLVNRTKVFPIPSSSRHAPLSLNPYPFRVNGRWRCIRYFGRSCELANVHCNSHNTSLTCCAGVLEAFQPRVCLLLLPVPTAL